MGTITITSKSHAEWLKSREGGIGSSEVATVLGVNPYDTPYQLWLRKTGRVPVVEEQNNLMRMGHILEDAIARLCAEEVGLDIVKNSAAEFVVVDKAKPFMKASPDRYAYPVGVKHCNDNKVIIECKSTQKGVDPDNISKYWFLQVIWQMRVTGVPLSYIAWLVQGRDFGFKPIYYDADFAKFVEEEVERFWIDCVVGGREPALINIQDVLVKFPKHEEGKKAYATDELVQTWAELKDTNEEIKRLQSVKEELETRLKSSMLDAERLVIPATNEDPEEKVLCTWKATKAGQKFDANALKEAEPEVYAKYLRDTEGSRRFACK